MITEKAIIKRSSALYSKYGFKSVSIDDVAFMLGISKKTLYENIENKNELIQKVVENNLEQFYSKITNKIDSSDGILKNLCTLYSNIIKEVHKINPSYVHDLKKYHCTEYKKIVDFTDRKLYKMVTGYFEKGIESGIFRKEIDIKNVYINQIHKISILLNDSYSEPYNSFSPDVVYRLILNDICGITTLNGHKIFDRLYNELLQLK